MYRKKAEKQRYGFGLSLRMRITLLTGFIILISSGALTLLSMFNAQSTLLMVAQRANTIEVENNSYFYAENPLDKFAFSIRSEPLEQPMIFTVETASEKFNAFGILSMGVISVCGMIAAYFLAGRALVPLYTLNQTILNISKHNLNERIPEKKIQDEVNELTHSFNKMLDRLEAAFKRQQQFASNAAHELKTPVAIINTGIQVLELEENPSLEDYQETVSITRRNIRRLTDVIEDLMLLMNDNRDYPVEEIPIIKMLEEIVEELQIYYYQKELQIEIQGKKEWTILANEALARHLFTNLIENAMKYNREQGIVKIFVHGQGGKEISILDTGIGIGEEEKEHIFEPFYCVDSSRARQLGGAGLGLSIVKEIAEQFGWEIQVKSEKEKGTEFIVRTGDGIFKSR